MRGFLRLRRFIKAVECIERAESPTETLATQATYFFFKYPVSLQFFPSVSLIPNFFLQRSRIPITPNGASRLFAGKNRQDLSPCMCFPAFGTRRVFFRA